MKKRTKDDRLKEKKKAVERIDGKAKDGALLQSPFWTTEGAPGIIQLYTFQW